jgi:Tat protein secretion system quality control protein TatD with DNase activity
MGTQPEDWQHIQELCAECPKQIRPNYGLHPWWAHDHPSPDFGSGWMLELRAALERDPSACLGEIGLDGQWVPPGLQEVQYEQQMEAFRQQLQLAVDLNRPVSLHCVKAYGDMFDLLRTAPALPPAVYMHSWGGKVGMLESYVKMKRYGDRFYFGFSAFANLRQNCHKTSAVIAAVPDDRLLLESDLEEPSSVPEALHGMLHVMANAKGWSTEETARITMQNAEVMPGSLLSF